MAEPKWNTHSLCSSNSPDSRKPGLRGLAKNHNKVMVLAPLIS